MCACHQLRPSKMGWCCRPLVQLTVEWSNNICHRGRPSLACLCQAARLLHHPSSMLLPGRPHHTHGPRLCTCRGREEQHVTANCLLHALSKKLRQQARTCAYRRERLGTWYSDRLPGKVICWFGAKLASAVLAPAATGNLHTCCACQTSI